VKNIAEFDVEQVRWSDAGRQLIGIDHIRGTWDMYQPVRIQDHQAERMLSAFGDYLLRNRLSDNKHARYLVYWVRRFLAHPAQGPAATSDEAMQSYLDHLEREGVKDWQRDQARQAVTAWLTWQARQTTEDVKSTPSKVATAPDGSVEPGELLARMEHTLRVRHYA
jgi:hypothetical protein